MSLSLAKRITTIVPVIAIILFGLLISYNDFGMNRMVILLLAACLGVLLNRLCLYIFKRFFHININEPVES
jgi:hypothetical protein